MNAKLTGLGLYLVLAWVVALIVVALIVLAHPAKDYTLNTTGKAIRYSVTPDDCLTGQYPKAATSTCTIYLQALYQRLSGENK